MLKRHTTAGFMLIVLGGALASWQKAHAAPDGANQLATEILEATGIRGGLVVHAGCGDGLLTAALRASDAYVVHGLARDTETLKKARAAIRARGLYGPVSVEPFDGVQLPYVDDLVNLLVADNPGTVPMAEVMRILAPRGVAYIKRNGVWEKTVKPWPKGIDEWTHYLHGPDNNAVAGDTRVGPPRSLKWKAGPLWCRSHDGVASSVGLVLSAKGRLFSLIDEGLIGQPGLPSFWTLVARDAFNGTLLWKKPVRGRLGQKSLVARGERLYLTAGNRGAITVLDAATGETIGSWAGTERTAEFVCPGDVLVVHRRGTRRSDGGKDDSIAALDVASGRVMWERPVRPITRNSLCAADGRVCFHNGGGIVCLSLRNGKELWQASGAANRRSGILMIYEGSVLLAAPGGLRAFAADTGKPLWKGPSVQRRLGVFGARGLVWVSALGEHGRTFLWTPAPVVARGLHPVTGDVKRTVEVSHLITPGHHVRCYPAKATERYLLLPKRGVEFVDLQGENHMRHDWLRGPCGHGVVAGNGLLYAPPHQCFCYTGVKLTGFNALSADQRLNAPDPNQRDRLQRGPAYARATSRTPAEASPSDWLTYRHDTRRSGRAGCDVPIDVTQLWKQDLGGKLSQPVVAGGRLLVAEEEAHTIHCLDAAAGTPLWHFTTGGRIDSPPTLHQGLVLCGSHDGYVYCLRATDGALVWRFHAAPAACRIAAFSQVESPWPVHGSVLVQNGVVYVTAGRSSFLDHGIWMYGLDPASGRVLHSLRLASPQPEVTVSAGRPFDMEGARTDLLVSDGTDLYMFFRRFAPDLSPRETPRITKLGDREVGEHLMANAGFLDTSWFDRSYWMYSRRWPGYYFAYNAPKAGRILVFDEEKTYGVHVFTTRQGHSPRFWPGNDGYELFADLNTNRPVLRPTAIGREKGNGFSRALPPVWSVQIPVRVHGLVLAGKYLYLAGPPDIVPTDDPMAAFEGRAGTRLWVVAAENGERRAEYTLEHALVFDGMIAAKGRLYLTTDDGHVICMGAKP